MQINLGKRILTGIKGSSLSTFQLSFKTKAIAAILAILLLPCIFLVVIPVHGNSGVTGTNLFLTEIGGDEVVYDGNNGVFWYPHLLEMIRMTRDEQQGFIDNLNADAYGKRTDWHFATLDQVFSLKCSFAEMGQYSQWFGPPGPSTPQAVWPVRYVDQFFPPTDVTPTAMGGMIMQIYNGRTADDWGLRRDPDNTTAVRFGEAADHFVAHSMMTPGEFATLTYNYDQHYMSDDATIMTSMQWFFGDLECSAWVISEAAPMVFEGSAEMTTPDLSYVGPAEFHILEHVVFLHINEEWFKWDITRHTGWGWVESYLCNGDLGKLSVTKFYSIGRINLIAAGYQQPITKVLFSGSA